MANTNINIDVSVRLATDIKFYSEPLRNKYYKLICHNTGNIEDFDDPISYEKLSGAYEYDKYSGMMYGYRKAIAFAWLVKHDISMIPINKEEFIEETLKDQVKYEDDQEQIMIEYGSACRYINNI